MKFKEFEYQRPNLEQLKAQYGSLIQSLREADSASAGLDAIKQIQSLQRNIDTQYTLVSIRHSIDTRDEFYEKENEFWDENLPYISEYNTDYYKAILDSPYLEDFKKELPETFFKMMENDLKVFSPEIIPLLQQENKLSSEYSRLLASAEIEFQGETYNLTGLSKFFESPDRAVRQEVNQLSWNFFQENLEQLDRIYDELVKLRHKMAVQLGFKDYVEMGYARMNRLDYTREDVEVYRKEVLKHVVPLVEYIYERQSKRLGIDSMKNYDLGLSFLSGNPTPKGDSEEIIANAKRMYSEMSPETKEYFDFMLEHDVMDLETKPGKQGGAYCTYIPNYKAPFLFANFNGTSNDVDVLTHEAGHGFQVFESRWIETPEVVWPTFETCEIHSMSMEFMAWPWLELFFKEQTTKQKYAHLAGTAIFLPYGVLVDHFQHEVYEHPEMTPEERRLKWRELEKLYNPWKDYDGNEVLEGGAFWMRQHHIYNSPFYYIDYTLAQVCALQFWQRGQIIQDDTFWEDYLAICKVGGTKSFTQVVELANLKVPFQEGSLESVSHAIRDYLEQIPESELE